MKEFIITKNDASLRLDKFITKNCPTLPSSLMFKYIRTKRIKVNGKRAEISTRLQVGDIVAAYINDEFFVEIAPKYDFLSASKKINIVYEDNHLLVVEKPINVPVQEDESKDLDLLTILKNYIKKRDNKPGNVYLGLVHRLDRPVGGVMVFAKTSKAASRLSDQVRTHSFKKK